MVSLTPAWPASLGANGVDMEGERGIVPSDRGTAAGEAIGKPWASDHQYFHLPDRARQPQVSESRAKASGV